MTTKPLLRLCVLGLPMIYGDVTTVPGYGKSLTIFLIVIITSSDTWGKNIPLPSYPLPKEKKEKGFFFRIRKYSIKPPTPDTFLTQKFFSANKKILWKLLFLQKLNSFKTTTDFSDTYCYSVVLVWVCTRTEHL